MDYWLLRGLRGVIKLMRIRSTYHIGFTNQVIKQAQIELRDVCSLIGEMETNGIPNYPDDPVASLAGIDHWIAQGYNGLNSHLHDRLVEGGQPIDPNTIELLKTEYARLGAIINGDRIPRTLEGRITKSH